MASLNRCEFIGNLGDDPELRYTQSGTAVARASIACNEVWNDRETGEKKERVEWVNLESWGKLAETASQYLKKGHPVYVAGQLRTDKYTPRDGGPQKYFTKVNVREMVLLSGGGRGRGEGANVRLQCSGGLVDTNA